MKRINIFAVILLLMAACVICVSCADNEPQTQDTPGDETILENPTENEPEHIDIGTPGLKFLLHEDGYYVSDYTGDSAEIIIPSIHEGIPVVGIGSLSFKDCTNITSISMPDSIKYIEERAFEDTIFYNTESNWENGVLYIGKHLISTKWKYTFRGLYHKTGYGFNCPACICKLQ